MTSDNQPSPAAVAAVRKFAERELSAEEFTAIVNAPFSDEESENTLALIRWFTRRYPTPQARLAYARRTYQRWQRNNRGHRR